MIGLSFEVPVDPRAYAAFVVAWAMFVATVSVAVIKILIEFWQDRTGKEVSQADRTSVSLAVPPLVALVLYLAGVMLGFVSWDSRWWASVFLIGMVAIFVKEPVFDLTKKWATAEHIGDQATRDEQTLRAAAVNTASVGATATAVGWPGAAECPYCGARAGKYIGSDGLGGKFQCMSCGEPFRPLASGSKGVDDASDVRRLPPE